MKVTAIKMSRI